MVQPPAIAIDLASPEAVVRQLARQIRQFIVEGHLSPGDELPGVRRLAMDLGIHFNTAAEAYRQLASDGWIEVNHGRAARVRKREHVPAAEETVQRGSERLRALIADTRAEGVPVRRIRRDLKLALEDLER